jgi:hypothetical protein
MHVSSFGTEQSLSSGTIRLAAWDLFRSQIFPQIVLCKKKILHHIKMPAYVWSSKYRWNQKLIEQFCCILRDEHFEPN